MINMEVYIIIDSKPRETIKMDEGKLVKDVLIKKAVKRASGEKILVKGIEVKDTDPLKGGETITYTSAKPAKSA